MHTVTQDPVCGMQVNPATAKHALERDHVRYLFCSAGCLKKFQADPAFLKKKPDDRGHAHAHTHAPASKAPASAAARYTCPMHPEVLKDGPGDCPICGMALVPVGAAAADTDERELRELTRRFWMGAVLSLPLVFLAMAPMAGYHEPLGLAPRARGWVEFFLGTPVVFWAGWPILAKFGRSFVGWNLNM